MDVDGEQQETQHWIETALDCNYLAPSEAEVLLEKCAEIGRLLGGMIAKADPFCNPASLILREEQSLYFTATETDLSLDN